MKTILFIIMIAFVQQAVAQHTKNGYAYLQPSFFIKKGYNNQFHLNFGAGFSPDTHIGFGGSFDVFVFKKNERQFAVAKADVKYFIQGLDKPTSLCISMQPGYVLYNGDKEKGRFAFDALFGMISRSEKGPGVTLNAGFSVFGFKTLAGDIYYKGLKIQAGLAF